MIHLDPLDRLRLQRGAEHLHALGARATAELLAEVGVRIGGLPCILGLLGEYQTAVVAPAVARCRCPPLSTPATALGAPPMSVTIAQPRERMAAVPIFRRADGSLSASTPDAPLVGPDGAQLLDDAGKRRYGKLISFDGAEARRRWNDAVLDAVTAAGIANATQGGNAP